MWKRLGLGVLVFVLLLSVGVGAVAAQTPDDEDEVTVENDLIARMAESMDLTREALLQTLLNGQTFREVMDQQGVTLRDVMPRPMVGRRGGPPMPHPEMSLDVLSEALGMEPEAIRDALSEGQTVPELIEAEGLSVEAVADDLKDAVVERVEDAVEEGKIDEDRADAMLERLEESDVIEQWLAGEAPFPGSRSGVMDRVREWLRSAPKVLRFLRGRLPRHRRMPGR